MNITNRSIVEKSRYIHLVGHVKVNVTFYFFFYNVGYQPIRELHVHVGIIHSYNE